MFVLKLFYVVARAVCMKPVRKVRKRKTIWVCWSALKYTVEIRLHQTIGRVWNGYLWLRTGSSGAEVSWTTDVLWLVQEALLHGIRHERVACSLPLTLAVLHPLPFWHNMISLTNFSFPTCALCTFIHWFSVFFVFVKKKNTFLHLYSLPIWNVKIKWIP